MGIRNVLKAQYGIENAGMVKTEGGLSAAAYKVIAANKLYFLKVYDKKRTQTPLWTQNIDRYMPILLWLNENTALRGKITCPVTTNEGGYRFEDDENVYVMFDYIEGETIAEQPLNHGQIVELAEILAYLHCCGEEIPALSESVKEDFTVPFCAALESYVSKDYAASPADVQSALGPCLEQLMAKVSVTKSISRSLQRKNVRRVLCHTDAHGWNLLQGGHLVLVDWEGMKLAPAEADLFMFAHKVYWDVFLRHYRAIRPDFVLDKELISFYCMRRKLEDIWAFLESILYDTLSHDRRQREMAYLTNECRDLEGFCF